MPISFKNDVMPILLKYGKCHQGFGGYETLVKKIVAGKPDESPFYLRMTGTGGPIMPPTGKLTEDLLKPNRLRIEEGAKNK